MHKLDDLKSVVSIEKYALKFAKAARRHFDESFAPVTAAFKDDVDELHQKLKARWFNLLKHESQFSDVERDQLRGIDEMPISNAKSPSSRIVLVLKATRLCNLRCIYCNVWTDGPGQVMSFGTMAKAVRQALLTPGIRQVDFVWHGGEITLLKPKFFRKLVALQERYRQRGQVISNSIQTNATKLTTEWLGLISVLELDVGISMDGPPEVHDLRRPTAAGQGSSAQVIDAVRQLREAGINHGILIVIDAEMIALPIDSLLGYFASSGIKHIDFLNYVPGNAKMEGDLKPSEYVSFADFSEWLRAVYSIWDSRYRSTLGIRFLDDLSGSLRSRTEANNCYFSGDCEERIFTIDVDGSIAPCDKFIGGPASNYGTIHQEDFGMILAAHAKLRQHAGEAGDLASLQGCRWHSLCRGGCPHDRIAARRFDPNYDRGCCGLGGLLDDIWSNECGDRSTWTEPNPAVLQLASSN
jgi:uncharacterized protein